MRPDYRFPDRKACLEVKWRDQSKAKEHLLAQVCDWLDHGTEDAMDVWTWIPSPGAGRVYFERDKTMQKYIDEKAGRAQGRKAYIEQQGKTWPRCWLVRFP